MKEKGDEHVPQKNAHEEAPQVVDPYARQKRTGSGIRYSSDGKYMMSPKSGGRMTSDKFLEGLGYDKDISDVTRRELDKVLSVFDSDFKTTNGQYPLSPSAVRGMVRMMGDDAREDMDDEEWSTTLAELEDIRRYMDSRPEGPNDLRHRFKHETKDGKRMDLFASELIDAYRESLRGGAYA